MIKSRFAGLRRQVGRRGAFLLWLALLDVIYAYGLAFPTARSMGNPTTRFLVGIMPLWIWALLWAVTGLICLVFAFRRWDAPGYAAAMFIKVLWAVTFLLGDLFAGVERGYLSTAIWGSLAGLLALVSGWRENNLVEDIPIDERQ